MTGSSQQCHAQMIMLCSEGSSRRLKTAAALRCSIPVHAWMVRLASCNALMALPRLPKSLRMDTLRNKATLQQCESDEHVRTLLLSVNGVAESARAWQQGVPPGTSAGELPRPAAADLCILTDIVILAHQQALAQRLSIKVSCTTLSGSCNGFSHLYI